jgi:hypothetical protein
MSTMSTISTMSSMIYLTITYEYSYFMSTMIYGHSFHMNSTAKLSTIRCVDSLCVRNTLALVIQPTLMLRKHTCSFTANVMFNIIVHARTSRTNLTAKLVIQSMHRLIIYACYSHISNSIDAHIK